MFKKGQLDYPIITFIVIIAGLILLAPIMLKIFISFKAPFSAGLGNVTNGGVIAQEGFNKVLDTGINVWDKVLVASFMFSILILFISAILIDTHPLFVILYIVISFFTVIFAPSIIDAMSNIYDSPDFATSVTYLPFMNSIRLHFSTFLIGVIVLTGIIIYGKITLFGRSNSRR